MSEPKWTPGPWHTAPTYPSPDGIVDTMVVDGEGLPIISDCETEADAHLIAAAPDLYEALDRLTTETADGVPKLKTMVAAAAALAKARGES